MHAVREIEVNENTALNCEDVIENVICIETVVRVASRQNSTVEKDPKNEPKSTAGLLSLQEKLYVRVEIHLVILLCSFM